MRDGVEGFPTPLAAPLATSIKANDCLDKPVPISERGEERGGRHQVSPRLRATRSNPLTPISRSHADAINPVNEALRAQRKSSTKIDRSFVIDIVSELDHENHTVCSRLDAKLYSVIIQILLESEDCRQGERGMYLLAVSMYHVQSLLAADTPRLHCTTMPIHHPRSAVPTRRLRLAPSACIHYYTTS